MEIPSQVLGPRAGEKLAALVRKGAGAQETGLGGLRVQGQGVRGKSSACRVVDSKKPCISLSALCFGISGSVINHQDSEPSTLLFRVKGPSSCFIRPTPK